MGVFLFLFPFGVVAQSDPYVVSIRMMEQLVNFQQEARSGSNGGQSFVFVVQYRTD